MSIGRRGSSPATSTCLATDDREPGVTRARGSLPVKNPEAWPSCKQSKEERMNDSQLDSRIGAAIATGARDVVAIADSLTTEQARIAERLIWLLGEGSVFLTTRGYVSTDEPRCSRPRRGRRGQSTSTSSHFCATG